MRQSQQRQVGAGTRGACKRKMRREAGAALRQQGILLWRQGLADEPTSAASHRLALLDLEGEREEAAIEDRHAQQDDHANPLQAREG